jgi:hypothetical protein
MFTMNYTNQSTVKQEAVVSAPRSALVESVITSPWIWHSFEFLFILVIAFFFKFRLRRTQSALYLQTDSNGSTNTKPQTQDNSYIPLVKFAAHKNGVESSGPT